MHACWPSPQPVCLTNFWSTSRLSRGLRSHPQSTPQAPVHLKALSLCSRSQAALRFCVKVRVPLPGLALSVPPAAAQCLAEGDLDA